MPTPSRGEVWVVDLGLVAKVRPCLVLNVAIAPQDRVLATLVPHTTAVHGTRFEVSVRASFLRPGAFDAEQLVTIPHTKLVRKLGQLPADQLAPIEEAVRRWLGL